MRFYSSFTLVLTGVAFFFSVPAVAGFEEQIPRTVDPRPATIVPEVDAALPPAPNLNIETLGGTAPPGADDIEATYRDLQLEGATVYGPDVTGALVRPLLGVTAPLSELFALAERLQARYLADGYFLTRVVVPSQESEGGKFSVRVVEGYIGSIEYEADVRENVRARLERIFAPVLAQRPVRIQTLERALLLANDQYGLSVVTTLRPGAEGAGASALVVSATEKRLEGSLSTNNRGSRFAGPWRYIGIGQANGLARAGDRLQLIGFLAHDVDEQKFGQVSYAFPLGADGLRLSSSIGYGDGVPGHTLSTLNVETSSLTANVSAEYPVWRSRVRSLWLTGAVNVTESHVRVLGSELSQDSLRVLNLGARYVQPQVLGGDMNALFNLRQGMPWLAGSEEGDSALSRPNGDPAATVVAAELGWQWPLFAGLGIGATGNGQYAFAPVLSDEEVRFGGDRFGRGYNASEVSGDHGVGTMLELTYGGTTGWRVLTDYQLYAFADYGVAWNNDVGNGGAQALASTGIGVRAKPLEGLFMTLELARPLERDLSSGEKAQGLGRVFFSLTSIF